MLTSFFGKSKPINFILLSIYLISGCFFYTISLLDDSGGFNLFQKQTLLLLMCLFSTLLLNFIVKKNYLTENNTYSIFFYTGFMLLIPMFFNNSEIIFSNLFLLLAFRRMLSLSSDKNREKKILDASIWITLAALFNFWCLLFFVVLFIAIAQQRSQNYKLLFIPLIGFSSIMVLTTSYYLIQGNSFLWFLDIDKSINLSYEIYNALSLLIPIILLTIVLLLSLLKKTINFSEIRLKEKSKVALLIMILTTSLIVALLIPNKTGAEFLYIMAPLSIFTANFVESLNTFWLKETLLWATFISPMIIPFL